mmetsp:Transcript_7618/g.18519  ORF Transcript_7618/g.18519 Transcript_7618/m.18519 type:complete len:99 (-) Transcript_7618:76-372(-)
MKLSMTSTLSISLSLSHTHTHIHTYTHNAQLHMASPQHRTPPWRCFFHLWGGFACTGPQVGLSLRHGETSDGNADCGAHPPKMQLYRAAPGACVCFVI